MFAVCPQCNSEFYKDEYWKRICIDCFKKNKGYQRQQHREPERRTESKPEQITPDVLKKLMYLCHPDKHNNSQVATDMFVWLSKMKKSKL
jgi:hypothetical protein